MKKLLFVASAMMLAGRVHAVDFSICDGFTQFAESAMKQRSIGTAKETTMAVLRQNFPEGKPQLRATLLDSIEVAYSFQQPIDAVGFKEMHRNICVDALSKK